MVRNVKKRLIIISVYLALSLLLTFGLYNLLKPEETCLDKIKNQNEENIDCGGVCSACQKIVAQNLIVGQGGYLDSGTPGQYDFWGEVSNPNNTFGSRTFHYEIIFRDSSGNVSGRKSGDSFILPAEKKYIIENNILVSDPASVEFVVSSPEWVEFNQYYERPNLKIVNKNYQEISSGTGFSEVVGLLKNESPFDFDLIKIKIIIREPGGKIIALNSTEMRTVKSKQEREFRAMWPKKFSGNVSNVEAQADVDVFNSQNFLKAYSVGQKFQNY